MAQNTPPVVQLKHLADYTPPHWLVPNIRMEFALDARRTLVRSRLQVQRNGSHTADLVLDGEALELLELKINGRVQPLPAILDNKLALHLEGDTAEIETLVAIRPNENSQLMGLYASGGNLCTQCEAEGFRRITFFPDRPDVLTRYSVRLEAEAAHYPVLLSNGNLVASGPLEDGRHYAEWEDPFPKPSYLFAAVAGRLSALEDSFTTRSGRVVKLAIWVAEKDLPRCHHAMDSLKKSFQWDEDHYGREYDLDLFNLVAVHDFNFGAMENKGLNIFNAKYVLADSDTATDWDFDAIAAIVAHEYFHNWSGNRVTCRDWFQLSLKEGFTVFRDQQFSATFNSPAVKRIENIRSLRTGQFAEDAGPLAHPVRPESYAEISNFYTTTIYDKGAELIRMQAQILGWPKFRQGAEAYFEANDGTAATVEDFLAAMAGQGLDTAQFIRWYQQPGTPEVAVESQYDPSSRQLTLSFRQSNPRASQYQQSRGGAAETAPLPIPMRFALFAQDGRKLYARDDLVLTQTVTQIVVEGIESQPILSLNRGFAAPVRCMPAPSREALKILAAHEDDLVARYEALQQLMLSALLQSIEAGHPQGHADVLQAFAHTLAQWEADPAFVAEALLLPSEVVIADQQREIDPAAIHNAREALRLYLADQQRAELTRIWALCQTRPDDLSAKAKGLRRLKGILLSLLQAGDPVDAADLALQQYQGADNMTDRMSALNVLTHSRHPARETALSAFYERFQHLPEVLDKWFLAQAGTTRADALDIVQGLLAHPQFDRRNPNRLRAVVMGLTSNQARFHAENGAGYRLLAEQVLLADQLNPQSAARLIQPLTRWRRFAAPWRQEMQAALAHVASSPNISRDLTEVVTSGLA